ncbi:hypothetical protein [Stenotrophomonas maltophilia]|uniref:hypothetical protein n=1 Tax=Stenotrophomonas maltophilia TaxID=40324 RepID=UPI002E7864A2|nr:hypothetical protein [Stenotrophomonas maltophilia]
MAEDQGGEEVIREIGKALALASELDPQIVRSLRSAIVQAMSDYEDDTNAQAAAALAAVLDFRPVTTQDALSQTLGEIGKLVEGLTGLEDVHYTVETPEGRRVDRPGFRRQLRAIINGNERGVYGEQAVHG